MSPLTKAPNVVEGNPSDKITIPENHPISHIETYTIKAEDTLGAILSQYDNVKTIEERDSMEEVIICTTLFGGNTDLSKEFLLKRKEIESKIANAQKKLSGAVNNDLEKELEELEKNLDELDKNTAKSIWMTDSAMEVHRNREKDGLLEPALWFKIVKLVREEYTAMHYVVTNVAEMQRRECDPHRTDMKRHLVYLLKYYGFTYLKPETNRGMPSCHIQHPFQLEQVANGVDIGGYKGGFAYKLMNPTWEDLEKEVRDDLISIGKKEEDLPPHYPETPTDDPSPVRTSGQIEEDNANRIMNTLELMFALDDLNKK